MARYNKDKGYDLKEVAEHRGVKIFLTERGRFQCDMAGNVYTSETLAGIKASINKQVNSQILFDEPITIMSVPSGMDGYMHGKPEKIEVVGWDKHRKQAVVRKNGAFAFMTIYPKDYHHFDQAAFDEAQAQVQEKTALQERRRLLVSKLANKHVTEIEIASRPGKDAKLA